MKRAKLKFLLLIVPVLFVTIIGFTTMGLWNWIMPALFGFGALSFFKAIGLLLLSRILLGGIVNSFRSRAYYKNMKYAYVHSRNTCRGSNNPNQSE